MHSKYSNKKSKRKVPLIFILIIILYFFNLKHSLYYKKFNFINIAMALNNNYTYPTMVSITSILINKKNKTFINFHLLIDNNVTKSNIHKIISLKNIRRESNFFFYNVNNNFNGFIINSKSTTIATFYRSMFI